MAANFTTGNNEALIVSELIRTAFIHNAWQQQQQQAQQLQQYQYMYQQMGNAYGYQGQQQPQYMHPPPQSIYFLPGPPQMTEEQRQDCDDDMELGMLGSVTSTRYLNARRG